MNREELFDKHLRGELSESEAAEMKQLLAQGGDAGRAFIEHVNETNLIVRVGSQLRSGDTAANVVQLETNSEYREKRRRTWLRVTAAAACVVGLAVAGIMMTRPAPSKSGAEGYVSGSGVRVMRAGAIVSDEVIYLEPGDLITTSTNDTAVVAYENESTRLEIFPGTVVRCGHAAAGKQFELQGGAIRASVAPQPADRPMLIATAHARATVVGTEFLVRADERATKLDVYNGKVELAGRSAPKKVVVKGGYWTSATSGSVADAKPLCKCSKCRGTNEPANCPNLKKKNEK